MTKITAFCFFLIIVLATLGVGSVSWALSVRVGMEVGGRISLSSPGGLQFEADGRKFSVAAGKTMTLEVRGNRLWWKEEGINFRQGEVSSGGGHFLFLNNRPYRGHFLLRNKGNGILVINQLALDDYLKGTIKLEISPNWPQDALRAQVVVSRTYAFRNLGRHRQEEFDFCSTTHCQRYGGVNAEAELTNRLIEETKGVILTYDGQPASVAFHSESGGFTENAADVWGGGFPYLISVPSPWEDDAPHANWSVEIGKQELTALLQSSGLIRGPIDGITLIKDLQTGRVKTVQVYTPSGIFPISAHRFREAVGFERLPSTVFDLEVKGTTSFSESEAKPTPQLESEKELTSALISIPREEWLETDWDLDDIMFYLETREQEREGQLEVESEPKSETEPELSSVLASIPREEWLEKDWDLDDIMFYLKLREQERVGQPQAEPLPSPDPSPNSNPPSSKTKVTTGTTFVFRGKGYGHGVGFSQWGARGMALSGFSWEEILTHYFPGCEIEKVAF
ncbi:MAG: stage sporulation protein [Candidatus Atribacteria bacterium]|nr:stage sporulation protein [Candidatus Atribacteria bacterium]